MKLNRSVSAFALCVLLFSVGSLLAAGGGSSGSIEGTFVGIERDYQSHFLIKDKDGHNHSYLIRSPDESVKPYLDDPAKFKGRPVKVYWSNRLTGDGPMFVKVESGVEVRSKK